jgi:cytochrome c-type biogenesis protein CcmH/NrfG
MSVAKVAHAGVQPEALWNSKQAYLLAVFCLLLGIPLGYFFRGSASPEPASPKSSEISGLPQPMSDQAQPSPEQMKAMVDRAAAPLLEQLKANPNDPDTLAKVGNVYFDSHQYGDAINYYVQALKLRPDNPDVRTDLGTAYWYSGNADKAIEQFQQSLKIRPDHAGTLFNLGVVRWQGKADPKGAVQAWEELLRRNPDYPQKQQVLDYIEKAKQHAARG